MTFSLEID